jgi:hypothetical protein
LRNESAVRADSIVHVGENGTEVHERGVELSEVAAPIGGVLPQAAHHDSG